MPILIRMSDIADLRKSYTRAELDESASHADPLEQFRGRPRASCS